MYTHYIYTLIINTNNDNNDNDNDDNNVNTNNNNDNNDHNDNNSINPSGARRDPKGGSALPRGFQGYGVSIIEIGYLVPRMYRLTCF